MTTHKVEMQSMPLRWSVKGPEAEQWLRQQGWQLPEEPYTWLQSQDCLWLKLGHAEFICEAYASSPLFQQCQSQLETAQIESDNWRVYPVTRFDACWELSGDGLAALFAEWCLLDVAEETQGLRLCCTQMAGVNVMLIQQQAADKVRYRLWCDGSYAQEMHAMLTQVNE